MRKSDGFSLIELLIVVAIILTISAIAIPRLMQARQAANEASAASTVRSITTAQIAYQISYTTYAPSVNVLGPGVPLGATHAGLVPSYLADAPHQHSGYAFDTTGDDDAFVVNGVPITPGKSGIRSFCSNTPGVVYYSPTETGCDPATSSPI